MLDGAPRGHVNYFENRLSTDGRRSLTESGPAAAVRDLADHRVFVLDGAPTGATQLPRKPQSCQRPVIGIELQIKGLEAPVRKPM